MADPYWRFTDPRFPPAAGAPPPVAGLKRPRSEFGGGSEMLGYYTRGEDDRIGFRPLSETGSIGASYDRYLHNGISSFGAAGESVRPMGGVGRHPIDELHIPGGVGDNRKMGYEGGRHDAPLPPDASCTLYVEGLPEDCSRREVSHIFRPFVGFHEVRLVKKDSKHAGGDPLILCFVDFDTPSQATVALDALQGYKFDESARESSSLRLQFARYAGPRSGAGPRPRR